MQKDILKNYQILKELNVSRETYLDLEYYISMIIEKNKQINIISKKNANTEVIRMRHVVDSVQVYDFIDLNYNIAHDLGTGAGFPGIVMAIITKNLGKDMKFKLYEKSYHKSLFLKDVSKQLNLDTEVIQEDIFRSSELETGTIISRAFKPLPVVIDLVYKNFSSYRNLILFMGKNGKKVLTQTLKEWDFDFKEKQSLTNKDSFLLNIKNIKRKLN